MGDRDQFERQLGRLADAFVNDILKASDEDILAEAQEEYGDSARAAQHVNELINKAKSVVGKDKLAAARASFEQDRLTRQCNAVDLPLERKRKIIQEFAAADTEQHTSLTLAARMGGNLSESDLDALLEALFELGAIDRNGDRQCGI